MTSQKKEKSLFCAENLTLGISSIAAVGVVAVYWWTVPKLTALEAECTKERKHREKLEKKVDDLSKRLARVEQEQRRHGNDIRNLQDDIDTHQVQLDSLAANIQEDVPREKSRKKKHPQSKDKPHPKKPTSYTPETSADDDNTSLDSSEEIDYQAIYDADKAEEKRKGRGRR